MDRKDWEKSLEQLKVMKEKHERDLEEVNYMIECYSKKVEEFGNVKI